MSEDPKPADDDKTPVDVPMPDALPSPLIPPPSKREEMIRRRWIARQKTPKA